MHDLQGIDTKDGFQYTSIGDWAKTFSLCFLFFFYYYCNYQYYYESNVPGAKEVKPSECLCRIKYDLFKHITTNIYSIFRLISLN